MIAWRIAQGIDILGGEAGAGWFVGTFHVDIEKKEAVKVQGKFIRWLRKELGYQVQYAATWEVTGAGRLHLNLVLAPWCYLPQSGLSKAWRRFGGGGVVWIQRVGGGIGVEAAKAREGLGGYLGKWEQMVKTGRGVAWSKKWPEAGQNADSQRRGEIEWHYMPGRIRDIGAAGVAERFAAITMFEYERDLGHWREVAPGEYSFVWGEECDCFELVTGRSPPSLKVVG